MYLRYTKCLLSAICFYNIFLLLIFVKFISIYIARLHMRCICSMSASAMAIEAATDAKVWANISIIFQLVGNCLLYSSFYFYFFVCISLQFFKKYVYEGRCCKCKIPVFSLNSLYLNTLYFNIWSTKALRSIFYSFLKYYIAEMYRF